MITPVTSHEGWQHVFASLPAWRLPQSPTLVVSPHPDDETLGCGGLIAQLCSLGVPVVIAAVTDGEAAYESSPDLGTVRANEQAGAVAKLGLPDGHLHRLHLPDSDVAAHEDILVERLEKLCEADMHIFAPWPGDFHPDHEACGRAAFTVARRTGANLAYYFFWTWHRGTPETLAGLPLRKLPLNRPQMRQKSDALACHRSQLQHRSGVPVLPEDLLWPTRVPFEVYLPA